MAVRFKKSGPLRKHFVAKWRRFRDLSQDDLAPTIGLSKATLSRIENGEIPYSQDFLEACAEALHCEPADLISRDPTAEEGVLAVWEKIPPAERQRALDVLAAFTMKDRCGAHGSPPPPARKRRGKPPEANVG